MQNLTFNLDDVFKSILARMENEGTLTQEAYNEMVEDVIEEKVDLAELDQDDDTEEYKEQLKARWPEAQASFESGHDKDVLEQE